MTIFIKKTRTKKTEQTAKIAQHTDSSIEKLTQALADMQISEKKNEQPTSAKSTTNGESAKKKHGMFYTSGRAKKIRFNDIPESIKSLGSDAVHTYVCRQFGINK